MLYVTVKYHSLKKNTIKSPTNVENDLVNFTHITKLKYSLTGDTFITLK